MTTFKQRLFVPDPGVTIKRLENDRKFERDVMKWFLQWKDFNYSEIFDPNLVNLWSCIKSYNNVYKVGLVKPYISTKQKKLILFIKCRDKKFITYSVTETHSKTIEITIRYL